VDPQAVALREQQQLRVEEPAVVHDEREQVPRDVGAQRLEAALRVAEVHPETGVDERVVAAGEHLALQLPRHARRVAQARPDRDLAVTREEGCDERQEALEVRGEVDVHVRDDVRGRREPRRPQGEAAALACEVERPHLVVPVGERGHDRRRRVGRRVVGDRHGEAERELAAQVGHEVVDVRGERQLFVVHGHDDLDRLQVRVHATK
jgi:hypothetical protein